MTATVCPNCSRPCISADAPTFETLCSVLPEFLPNVGTCVECFDHATRTARTFGRGDRGQVPNGRTFDSATAVTVSASLSRLYEDRAATRGTRPAPARVPAPTRPKFTVNGVDLRSVLSEMLQLESLSSLAAVALDFTVNRTRTTGGVSGFYRNRDRRVHLCVRTDATVPDAEGVLLHELCHAACAAEGIPFRDTDETFAEKCRAAMTEWTQKNPDRPCDHVVYGAYRGATGRRNKAEIRNRARANAALTPDQVAVLRELANANPELAATFFASGRVSR